MKQLLKLAVLFLFLLPGCTSSRITSSWKADMAQPQTLKKIIVLGLIRENDRHLRESMEEQLVAGLRTLGYDATCSCDEYNPKAFENMNEEQALAKLRTSGVDAVMTIVLLDKTRERYYVPGRLQYTPYYTYYNRFWGYSRTMYGRIYSEGYYTEDTKYFWESNLYLLNGNTLLYSAQSQSFDPASAAIMGEEHSRMLTKDMLKKNVLKNLNETKVKKSM
jgi:hypothetical protein